MDYWAETMQDDCYAIAADGWKVETYRVIEKDKKGKEKDKGWACDLVPRTLIVARYFASEQAGIDKLPRPEVQILVLKGRLEFDGARCDIDRVVNDGQGPGSQRRIVIAVHGHHREDPPHPEPQFLRGKVG